MISRRNIRVKVMQTLYSLSSMEPGKPEVDKRRASDMLNEKLNRSLELFTLSILYTIRVAQYAETDAHRRSGKYLPTADDLAVNTRIVGNEYLWQIVSSKTFSTKVKESKLELFIDEKWVRDLYQKLASSDEYKTYITQPERKMESEKAIIQFIWENIILNDEKFLEYFSEEMPGWEDDFEMTKILMEQYYRNNSKVNFLNLLSVEKKDYAHDLLHTAMDKEAYCMELIQPKLINWDAERVALIDLILLRMGVCELLYFPTIPTKVTINEFIEIAKQYSTPQSGQFINGVLDNILKDLTRDDMIHKKERPVK